MNLNFTMTLASATLASFLALPGQAFAEDTTREYRHPVAVIPYAWEKPTIDGVVDDKEWQGAFSQQGLQTTDKQISTRQARFWMMWDEENIYVAMRSPLREGERVVNALREREREVNVVFDDSYEIWISVGATDPLTGQPNCITQFLANFSGARYDALHQPAVGNQRGNSYSTGWEPVNRITPNNEWEFEMVIPRASLGTTDGPFHDGQHFRCLIARNFKRPWEQNSFEGTSSFSVVDTHSEFIMSKSYPAMQLLSVGDSLAGKVGIQLAAFGQADSVLHWRYTSDDIAREGEATVKKGSYESIVDLPEIDRPEGGNMRITVTAADGATLLDWEAKRSFSLARRRVRGNPGDKPVFESYNVAAEILDDKGDQLDIRTMFNPEKDYIRVFGDLINFDNRDAIADIVLIVKDAEDKELKRMTTQIDELAYARGLITFDTLETGEYRILLECRDAEGNVIASRDKTFEKKDPVKAFEWWETTRGNIEKVIAPWTPVTFEQQHFGVWGREMVPGVAGLPAAVSTQGHDVLASPGRLVATMTDGKEVAAVGSVTKMTFDKDHRKTLEVLSTLGDIDISSEVTVEFDGLYRVEMTLTPQQATTVSRLQIVLPYSEPMAEYIHAVTAEIRSGFHYGFTPEGEGRVWDCTLLGDNSMKVGSFIPYIWLGSTKGGLSWFADSDEGWIPSNDTPAIEIRRDRDGEIDLVFNLVSTETTLDQPRTITFGLQSSPVKPMHQGWREDNWWCGDTFKNYAHTQNLIFASTPFVVPSYAEKAKEMVVSQHRQGKPAVPYFIHTSLPGHLAPEMNYFHEQWQTTVDDALCYRGSFIDYMVHNWSKWSEDYDIDGYYIDNMRPILCDNIEHGCGYRLPDGQIQPTFQMFDTREYFLRSRALFLEQRPTSRLILHMTNAMIIPWVGAADVAYDGEHYVIYPEMGKDFMDFWSLERLRVDYPDQWGVAVNFMHAYQGQWDPADLQRVKRAYFAAIMLHDALPTGNQNGHADNLIAMRANFGIGDDNVRFLPYWEETGIQVTTEDFKPAAWLKPDKLLLLVANFGEKQTGEVSIDPVKLGWGDSPFTVTDAERGYQFKISRRVKLTPGELARNREDFEKNEANRLAAVRTRYENQLAAARNNGSPLPEEPDMEPRVYREQTHKRVPDIGWDGDQNVPVTQNGNTLTVPVERHNYRLLLIKKD